MDTVEAIVAIEWTTTNDRDMSIDNDIDIDMALRALTVIDFDASLDIPHLIRYSAVRAVDM